MAVPSDYAIEDIAQVLEECGGYVSAAARALDCKISSLQSCISNHAELRDVQQDVREEMLDNAERWLSVAVEAGKPWAIKLVLTRLGRKRGYGHSIELEQKPAASGRVVLYLPDDGREEPVDDGDSPTAGPADGGPNEQG